jgi:hypothetical protein
MIFSILNSQFSIHQNERHQRRIGTAGSMLMEFVLVMPLLFVLIMGVVQMAHIWTARMVTHYAAFCAARATLTMNDMQAMVPGNAPERAARQVCAWVAFSDDGTNEADVPGWGQVPHSAELAKRVRVRAMPSMLMGASWLSGAKVEFDFPLLIPVAGTMMGWLATHERADADYKVGSGWTGQFDHGNYSGPYITLSETVWLPKPYSTQRYPLGN